MRVLIMSDMEGVSGIVDWDQVNGGAPMYEEGRRLYTEEINAAVRGAKAAGATEIVAVDCHGAGKDWTFNSFVPELIDPDCEWVSDHPWCRYTEMLRDRLRRRADGRHARPRRHARRRPLPHHLHHHLAQPLLQRPASSASSASTPPSAATTASPSRSSPATTRPAAKAASCSATARHRRRQARPLPLLRPQHPPGPRPADDRGRRHRSPQIAATGPSPTSPTRPTTITIDLCTVDSANQFKGRHGVELVEPLKVVSKGKDWMQAWNQIWHW